MHYLFIETRNLENKKINKDKIKRDLKNYKKVALVSTVQELHKLFSIKQFLKSIGKKVIIPKGNYYKGQVLGCQSPKSKVDCFIYVGDGLFHPIQIAIDNNNVDVYILYKNSFLDKNLVKKILRKRLINKELIKNSKKIGILISLKIGQNRLNKAIELGKKLKKEGKEVFYFLSETLSDDIELNFKDIDGWINTMCPRLVDDTIFKKPMVNFYEL